MGFYGDRFGDRGSLTESVGERLRERASVRRTRELRQNNTVRDEAANTAKETIEKRERVAPIENEYKILDLGEEGVKEMEKTLEARDYTCTFDGTVISEYYELSDGSAPKELGDWPRIRQKKGVAINKETGEPEEINQFEFQLKGKVISSDGAEVRKENGTARFTIIGNTLHYTTSEEGTAFEVARTFETPEEAETAAHQMAIDAMHAFVRIKFPDVDATRLTFWHAENKHRTSYSGDFVENEETGEVRGVNVDIDAWQSDTVVFQEDTVIPNEKREQIVALYQKANKEVPAELLVEGDVTLKKGARLEIPLDTVPAFAEFELVGRDSDSPEFTQKLEVQRKALYDNMIENGVFRPEQKTVGNLEVVKARHNVPEVGMSKASSEELARTVAARKAAEEKKKKA